MTTSPKAPISEPTSGTADSPAAVASAGAGVSLRGVQHRYGDLQVLAGIDLEIASGEVIGLVGPSGCGKSTLLELIGGLAEPSAGAIEVTGTGAERLAGCAHMPQRDL